MNMRISTSQIYESGITSLNNQQSDLLKIQQQISAGRSLLTPADDPVGASRELTLTTHLQVNNQLIANQTSATSELSSNENYISSAQSALTSIMTRLVQGGNTSLGDLDRDSIVSDLQGLRSTLMGIANTQDANGNYLFAGYSRSAQPFVQTGTGVAYQGDSGVRQAQIGPNTNIDVSFTGEYLFNSVPTGDDGLQTTVNAGNTGNLVLTSSAVSDHAAWDNTITAATATPVTATTPTFPYTVDFTKVTKGSISTISGLYQDPAAPAGTYPSTDPTKYLTANPDIYNNPNDAGITLYDPPADYYTYTVQDAQGNYLVGEDPAADTNTPTTTTWGTPPVTVTTNAVPGAGGINPTFDGAVSYGGVKISLDGTPGDGDSFSFGQSTQQSVFDTIDQAIAALQAPASDANSAVVRTNALYNVMQNLQGDMDRLTQARSAVGARQTQLAAATDSGQVESDAVTTQISTVVGADPASQAKLASDLAQKTYAVQAAQQSYTAIANLSIFNYLK